MSIQSKTPLHLKNKIAPHLTTAYILVFSFLNSIVMLKTKMTFFLLFVFSVTVFAQNEILKKADVAFEAKDYEKAASLYQEQEKDLSPRQMANLGLCYHVMDKNELAVTYFKKAAEKEDAHGYRFMGFAYERGLGGLPQAPQMTIKYYEKAAEKNDDIANSNLGYIYFHGVGVDVNKQKAATYYTKGADLGSSRAMNNLGTMYRDGDYVEKDLKKAFELFEKAALDGDLFGMSNLANLYETGTYVEKNIQKAIEWYEKAANQG